MHLVAIQLGDMCQCIEIPIQNGAPTFIQQRRHPSHTRGVEGAGPCQAVSLAGSGAFMPPVDDGNAVHQAPVFRRGNGGSE